MLECRPLYLWARSSTAEQWPFKPLVLGSNPSALIHFNPSCGDFCLVQSPRREDAIRISARSLDSIPHTGIFVWFRALAGRMPFESQRAHSFNPSYGDFCLVQSPHREDGIRICARSLIQSLMRGFLFGSEPSQGGCHSNLSALTRFNPSCRDFCLVQSPRREDGIRISARSLDSILHAGIFVWFKTLSEKMHGEKSQITIASEFTPGALSWVTSSLFHSSCTLE
jgi:hypothetical protein